MAWWASAAARSTLTCVRSNREGLAVSAAAASITALPPVLRRVGAVVEKPLQVVAAARELGREAGVHARAEDAPVCSGGGSRRELTFGLTRAGVLVVEDLVVGPGASRATGSRTSRRKYGLRRGARPQGRWSRPRPAPGRASAAARTPSQPSGEPRAPVRKPVRPTRRLGARAEPGLRTFDEPALVLEDGNRVYSLRMHPVPPREYGQPSTRGRRPASASGAPMAPDR